MTQESPQQKNWAGNYEYQATGQQYPRSVEEVQSIVASAEKVRALGSRHSFNSIADTSGVQLSLARLEPNIVINPEAEHVTVSAGTTYGVLAKELASHGYALHNLASLPHISIGGAVATGTHGSGDKNANLASAVIALKFVDASGTLHHVSRSDTPDFAGYVVGLGALGIVTELTLRIENDFSVAQHVYQDLPWEQVIDNYDAITQQAYSVSLFTDWSGESISQLWFKQRLNDGLRAEFPRELFGARAAESKLHPLPGIDPLNCTEQLGEPGPWTERLAHFKMDFLPSAGNEIQSEYLIPREHAIGAFGAMRALSAKITPLLQIAEIRTIAADDLWMSGNYGRDGVGLHFTWLRDQAGVEAILPEIEAALAPFDARPHWGKVFTAQADVISQLYARFEDFRALVMQHDPTAKFGNEFSQRALGFE